MDLIQLVFIGYIQNDDIPGTNIKNEHFQSYTITKPQDTVGLQHWFVR